MKFRFVIFASFGSAVVKVAVGPMVHSEYFTSSKKIAQENCVTITFVRTVLDGLTSVCVWKYVTLNTQSA